MTRRFALVIAGIAAAAVGFAPSYAAAAPACVTFADPKGDTSPAADPSLDITSVTWKTTGKSLVGTITVDKGAIRPLLAPGSRFDLRFTVGGKDVTMFYKNGPARAQEANGFFQQGLRVNDVVVTGEVTGGLSGNVLTMSVKYAVMRGALGVPVLGATFTKLDAQARAAYLTQASNVTYDNAAPKGPASFVGGTACT